MAAYETGAVVFGGFCAAVWGRPGKGDPNVYGRNRPRIAINAAPDNIDGAVYPAATVLLLGADDIRALRQACDEALANEPEAA